MSYQGVGWRAGFSAVPAVFLVLTCHCHVSTISVREDVVYDDDTASGGDLLAGALAC